MHVMNPPSLPASKCDPALWTDQVKGTARSFSYAKHRIESMQKPLGRNCLLFDATLACAHVIVAQRGLASPEGRVANTFLADVTEEAYLQLAMMADGSDESLRLIRAADVDYLDESEFPAAVTEFTNIITHLFGHGKCLEVPGYTTYAMTSFCKPRLIQVKLPGGVIQTRSIGNAGGVAPVVVHRCLTRMRVWQELVDWASCAHGTPEHCSANA